MSANGGLKIFYAKNCRKRSEDSLPTLQFFCYSFLNLNYWNILNTLFNLFYTKWKILMHPFEIHFYLKTIPAEFCWIHFDFDPLYFVFNWHFEILKIQICKGRIVPLRYQILWKLFEKLRFYKQKLFFEIKFEAL